MNLEAKPRRMNLYRISLEFELIVHPMKLRKLASALRNLASVVPTGAKKGKYFSTKKTHSVGWLIGV